MQNSLSPANYISKISFIIAVMLVPLLIGCNASTPLPGAIQRDATVILPTQAPTTAPTPANTRVLPVDALTPAPTPTITPIPDEVMGLVVDVIDGDTLAVVLDGDRARQAYTVKYLGIEAPDDPWGTVAYETNEKLTKLKIVRLVRDQTDFDAEGYLLRYVYVDNQLINVTLVEQGLARADIEAPNTRFEDEILAAETRARNDQRGLWGPNPPTPTATSQRANQASSTQEATGTSISTAVITGTTTSTATAAATAEDEPATEEPATTEAGTTEPTSESTPDADETPSP